jgi:transposase InsO family protein
LRRAGWRLERVLTDNGNEFGHDFHDTISGLGARHTRIRAGRSQTNGHVERLHRTILEECWRPAFARFLFLRYRACNASSTPTSSSTTTTVRTPAASPTAAARPNWSTVPQMEPR